MNLNQIKIALFEDDDELSELLVDMMRSQGIEVRIYGNLKDDEWHTNDIVLADFRNKFVSFEKIRAESEKKQLPLIAISGDETNFNPQLLKPFTIEELLVLIAETIQKFEQANKQQSNKKTS